MEKIFDLIFPLFIREFYVNIFKTFKIWYLDLFLFISIVILRKFTTFALDVRYDEDLLTFTKSYFYDGIGLYFIAWKIHLFTYIMCYLLTNEKIRQNGI